MYKDLYLLRYKSRVTSVNYKVTSIQGTTKLCLINATITVATQKNTSGKRYSLRPVLINLEEKNASEIDFYIPVLYSF
jgi:hypothetical protein